MNPTSAHADVERSVVAAVLAQPNLLDELDTTITERDFGQRGARLVYRTIRVMHDRGDIPDLLSIAATLEQHKQLDAAGDFMLTLQLGADPEDLRLVKQHAKVVRERALLREVGEVARKALEEALDGSDDPHAVIERTERAILALQQRSRKEEGYAAAPEVVADTMREIEQMLANRGVLPGISTGFPELDAKMGGLRPGNLYLIAGRPSMGKTSMMLNIAAEAVLREGARTVIHSLEMPDTSIMQRLLAMEATVNMQAFTNGTVTQAAATRLRETAEKLAAAPLKIDDSGTLTLSSLRSQARREAAREGVDVLMVDYLQLMSSGEREENRTTEVSRLSRELKLLARELEVPVVVLSQLNRGVEARANKRPMLSDLRESGSLEQDADVVMFLYRDEYYDPDSSDKGLGEVIIAKQRNGPVGTLKVRWVDALASYRPLEVPQP